MQKHKKLSPLKLKISGSEQGVPQAWRSHLRAITRGGSDLVSIIVDLARGVPHEVVLPNGTITQPQVPPPAVRLAAAVFLHEQLNGKAVTQDRVVHAEVAAQGHAAYLSLSDDELETEIARLMSEKMPKQLVDAPAPPVVQEAHDKSE
jgi:hypothetical protein